MSVPRPCPRRMAERIKLAAEQDGVSSGVAADGARWWLESGVEEQARSRTRHTPRVPRLSPALLCTTDRTTSRLTHLSPRHRTQANGRLCRWWTFRGVSADGATEWEEKTWETSDAYNYKEIGAEKSGRDSLGRVWREAWTEHHDMDAAGLRHIWRSADKWAKAADGSQWHEKWNEARHFRAGISCVATRCVLVPLAWLFFSCGARINFSLHLTELPSASLSSPLLFPLLSHLPFHPQSYGADGRTERDAYKFGALPPGTIPEDGHAARWCEKWGEKWDGRGFASKWADKWGERDQREGGGQYRKWGDKWSQEFRDGVGHRWGETWNDDPDGGGWCAPRMRNPTPHPTPEPAMQ